MKVKVKVKVKVSVEERCMTHREQAEQAVLSALAAVNEPLPDGGRIDESFSTVLLGPAGGMDSLTLVEFVLAIEETLANEFGRNVAVAPMERIDTSETGPFRTVGSLVAHVATLLEEEESAA